MPRTRDNNRNYLFDSNYDTFEWWKPWDWGGGHDETSMWRGGGQDYDDYLDERGRGRDPSRERDYWDKREAELDEENWFERQWDWATQNKEDRDRDYIKDRDPSGEAQQRYNEDVGLDTKSRARRREEDEDRASEQQEKWEKRQEKFFKQYEQDISKRRGLIDNLQGEASRVSSDTLKELGEFKGLFKQRLGMGDDYLGQQVQQAKDYQRAPSVVDAMLQQAFMQQKSNLVDSYSKRSGAGYLEDFNNQNALGGQKLFDAGVGQRLAEEQQKQQTLMNVLGGAAGQQYNNVSRLPYHLIDKYKSARGLPLAAQSDAINFLQQEQSQGQGLLGQLYGFKSGDRDYASQQRQMNFLNDMANRGQNLNQAQFSNLQARQNFGEGKQIVDTGIDIAKEVAKAVGGAGVGQSGGAISKTLSS